MNTNTEEQPRNVEGYTLSPKELKVVTQCQKEKLVIIYGLMFGSTAASFYLVATGKIKGNKHFGAFPKICLSAVLSQWAGKLLYAYSGRLPDKILKEAPDGRLAYDLRKERGIKQPWTSERDFDGKDLSYRNVPANASTQTNEQMLFVQIAYLHIIVNGLTMFGSQRLGWIPTVRETNAQWVKKLPIFPFRNRTVHGIMLGLALQNILLISNVAGSIAYGIYLNRKQRASKIDQDR